MTSVSIQNSSGVTFVFQESDIIKVQSIITGDIDHSSMPISGPMGAMGFDIAGGVKIIGIDGVLTLASSTRTSTGTVTTILQQKQWLESLIDGNQIITVATSSSAGKPLFTSTYESYSVKSSGDSIVDSSENKEKTTVMIQKLTFSEETGRPNELIFTMNLIVAGI